LHPFDSRASPVVPQIDSERLHLRHGLLDCGAVQSDALTVDREASLAKYNEVAMVDREAILEREVAWLKDTGVTVVATDIVPLACPAAKRAGTLSPTALLLCFRPSPHRPPVSAPLFSLFGMVGPGVVQVSPALGYRISAGISSIRSISSTMEPNTAQSYSRLRMITPR